MFLWYFFNTPSPPPPPKKKKSHPKTVFFVLLWALLDTTPPHLAKSLDTGAAFVGSGSISIQWWGSAANDGSSTLNQPSAQVKQDFPQHSPCFELFSHITSGSAKVNTAEIDQQSFPVWILDQLQHASTNFSRPDTISPGPSWWSCW